MATTTNLGNLRGPSLWPTACEQYIEDRSDRIRTPATRKGIRSELSRLQRRHPGLRIGEFTEEHLVAFCKFDASGERQVAPNTQRIRCSYLITFFLWALRSGLVATDPAENLRQRVNPRRRGVMQRQWLNPEEFQAVLDLCAADEWQLRGHRDQVLITLAATTGLRRAELASLRWRHIRLGAPEIQVENGKGQKHRVAGITNEVADLLNEWQETVEIGLGRSVRGSDAVLPRVRWVTWITEGTHRTVYWESPLVAGSLYFIIRGRVLAATSRERFSPHDLRRSYASWAKERYTIKTADGVEMTDWNKVRQALGHEQVATTIAYCKDDGLDQARVGQDMQFGFTLKRPASTVEGHQERRGMEQA